MAGLNQQEVFKTTKQIAQDVAEKALPYARTYTPNGAGYTQKIGKQTLSGATKKSQLEELAEFGGKFIGQVADIGKGLIDSTLHTATAVYEAPMNFGKAMATGDVVQKNSKRLDEVHNAMSLATKDYSAGKINRDEYAQIMTSLSKEQSDLTNLNSNLISDLASEEDFRKDVTDAALTAISLVLAVGTGGTSLAAKQSLSSVGSATVKATAQSATPKLVQIFGNPKIAFQLSDSASKMDSLVLKMIEGINKVTTLGGKFETGAFAKIITEATAQAGVNATAKEIAKSAVINLLIKKPLIYQQNFDTAIDIYNDIAEADYGGAVGNMALATSFFLSGGPIGWAMNKAGKAASWLTKKAFAGEISIAKDSLTGAITKGTSRESYLDIVSELLGKERSAAFKTIMEDLGKDNIQLYKVTRVFQEMNMKMGGDELSAAHRFADWILQERGKDWVANASMRDILETQLNHFEALNLARDSYEKILLSEGVSVAEAAKLKARMVVGRVGSETIDKISNAVYKADKSTGINLKKILPNTPDWEVVKSSRARAIMELLESDRYAAWANNPQLMGRLEQIISNNISTSDMMKQLKKITRTTNIYEDFPKEIRKKLQKLGYIPNLPKRTITPYVKFEDIKTGMKTEYAKEMTDVLGKNVSALSKGFDGDIFEQAVKPSPILSTFSSLLTRAGLSPEASTKRVNDIFRDNFNKSILDNNISVFNRDKLGAISTDVRLSPDGILSKLYGYRANYNSSPGVHKMITDLRQFSTKDVIQALGIDEKDAKIIMASIQNGYLNIPIEIRGLGDKAIDYLNKSNIAKKYSSIQGAARYSYNPFFKWQQAVQTETATQMILMDIGSGKQLQLPGLNKVNKILFGSFSNDVDTAYNSLVKNGIFPASFGDVSRAGDTTGDLAESLFGSFGSRLTKGEKTSVSGLVAQLAKNNNQDIETYVKGNVDRILDIARTVTQNDFRGDWLDSPMARTINTIFFPFRFNMKIAGQMAEYISRTPKTVQIAMIGNMIDSKQWFESEEGTAWQSEHAEAIKLFQWMSPFAPLQYALKLGEDIVNPAEAHIGDLGLLGGLPFGWITQMLEHAGVTNFSQPYVDISTGKVASKYVPKDSLATVGLALQDLLASLFSYPGQLVGLPGKTQMIRNVVTGAIGTGKYEEISQEGRLTPQQRRQVQYIKSNKQTVGTEQPQSTESTDSMIAQSQVTAVTPQTMRVPEPIYKNKSTATAKKKKKKDIIPNAPVRQ